MPKDFLKCVREDGKVITKKLPGDKYIYICYDKDGKAYKGEVHYKKSSKEKKK